MTQVVLPLADGRTRTYRLGEPRAWPASAPPPRTRVAYAAAHVVADPASDPRTTVDWDATLRYRHHLWSLGFGVAEAMDTAQRGMGLSWENTRELIRRSCREAQAAGGRVACGAGTDQLAAGGVSLQDITEAYLEQCAHIESSGGRIILMASRALAATARSADDYAQVYGEVLRQVGQPVILHWLGEMFDPSLRGYWGSPDLDQAADACLALIRQHAARIDGIKISLLDAGREIGFRRQLPAGVRMYTGDDFNYPRLIAGDEHGHSDALLGIFDAIAPAAATAFAMLDGGDRAGFEATLEPTVPLSRHIFSAPTYHYKTGVVFLAYLNGFQDHFRMLGGLEDARSLTHLAELVVLADQAGLLLDPPLAAARLRQVLNHKGVVA